jgi:hypothetical protein
MIEVDYGIVLVVVTLIYTVLVHLLNWWARNIDEDLNPEIVATLLIICHIILFIVFSWIIIYPL